MANSDENLAWQILAAAGAAVQIRQDSDDAVWSNGDRADLAGVAPADLIDSPEPLLMVEPFDRFRTAVRLRGGALLVPPTSPRRDICTGVHLRSVLAAARELGDHAGGDARVELSGGWALASASQQLTHVAEAIATRLKSWGGRADDFTNSASYMGSKRTLLPFLMEPLARWTPPEAVFVDLMCGSGAVASAAARLWTTVASDAQRFCLALAGVQGGGFDRTRSQRLLRLIRPSFEENEHWLTSLLDPLLREEDELLHSPSASPAAAAAAYSQFVSRIPAYPNGGVAGSWQPNAEVERRRSATSGLPACLFSAYYADLYVGVRQAIEIDSLRHAIAQLEDAQDRQWALGALTIVTSLLGTSYGGHFAQPIATPERLKVPQVYRKVVSKRSMSVTREFEARLGALAMESETARFSIRLVGGPWRPALKAIGENFPKEDVVVYLDAPYKREEYSRYYHLLETLVRYNYPAVAPKTRIPNKSSGDRYSSEFFTRSRARMTRALADVIDEVMSRGWRCAWSYADNAGTSISDVLESLTVKPRGISGVATDHLHRMQGSHARSARAASVRETLLMLEP